MTAKVSSTPYKRAQLSDQWDAIVIGSGIGGLTAAAMLSIHGGKRVLVLERHYVAGGFTHTFHRPGFEWDVGLHYIGQVQDPESPVRKAFDHITNNKMQWAAMPAVYDRVIFAGRNFDLIAGEEQFRQSLLRSFPGEAKSIDKYLRAIHAANRWSGLYYAEKAIPAPVAAIIGPLLRAPYLRWARRTTLDVLNSITSNRELIGVLTAQWGDYGLPPAESSFAIHATIVEHYLGGASYPVGGAVTIAASIIPQIERSGGMIVTSADVAEILLEGNTATGVRMAEGRVFRSDLVISDAGANNTFNRLLPTDLPATQSLCAQLRTLRASTAHLSLYVGLNATAEDLKLEGTNLWIYPSFDHDQNIRRFTADADAPFPAVYISFPSAKDPDFTRRHPGKSTIELIVPVEYEAFAGWSNTRWKQRGADYVALKQTFTTRLLDELHRQVPQVAGYIEHAELSTPVTTQHFTNYERGEIYGIAATPARHLLRALGARTPVKNLYLTGQDAATLGVVGAMYGGVICASVALKKNLISAISKPLPS